MTALVLTDPGFSATGERCVTEAGHGWHIPHVRADCRRLDRIDTAAPLVARCSVCSLPWSNGVVSRHEHCATLGHEGRLTYATVVMSVALVTGETVELRYSE